MEREAARVILTCVMLYVSRQLKRSLGVKGALSEWANGLVNHRYPVVAVLGL